VKACKFQCSSASRKFLNNAGGSRAGAAAEFQCSSASRKFLNDVEELALGLANVGFQCSSASRKFLNSNAPSIGRAGCAVSVLFSEPKIPQLRNYSHC